MNWIGQLIIIIWKTERLLFLFFFFGKLDILLIKCHLTIKKVIVSSVGLTRTTTPLDHCRPFTAEVNLKSPRRTPSLRHPVEKETYPCGDWREEVGSAVEVSLHARKRDCLVLSRVTPNAPRCH